MESSLGGSIIFVSIFLNTVKYSGDDMFGKIRIGTRLVMGFGAIMLLAFLSLAILLKETSIMYQDVDLLINDRTPKVKLVEGWLGAVNALSQINSVVLHLNPNDNEQKKGIDFEIGRYASAVTGVEENTKNLKKLLNNEEGKKLLQAALDAQPALIKAQKDSMTLHVEGKHDDAMKLFFTDGKANYFKNVDAITKLQDFLTKEVTTVGVRAMTDYHRALTSTIVIGFIAFILACIIAFVITRSITVPITTLTPLADSIAKGDLTTQIPFCSKDEIGQLSESLRKMVANLHCMVASVSDTSNRVATAANQLNETSEQIAAGSEEVVAQASSVATAGEEMSATANDIAKNCQMAAEGANRAFRSAHNGAEVVGETMAVMEQIAGKVKETALTVEKLGARSDQIGKIIGTIEDIADQTNLLALNAAIEAARAGEQGRGFAVVADEVRALAERTTCATCEIGEMIKAIQNETKGAVSAMEQGVQQVEAGTVEAAKSGEALHDILAQVNNVAMQVNQIATAAEEQTATTTEISSNISQITDVVQQTSQGAQQSSSAAAQLSGSAEELQRLVRQFKL